VRGGRSRATLGLHPAQHERPDPLAEARRRRPIALRDRLAPALLKVGAAAEQAGVGEVELAPQLVEPVLDRRARQRQLPPGLEPVRGARDLAVGVLDRLRFVEDHGVPCDPGQDICIVAEQRIAGQHDVGAGLERAARTAVGRDL